MLTEEQKTRIENLYREYYDDIKPLTFYVERKYHKFPKGLLKEYRDVYDHISRCYANDSDEVLINENLKKAENHFERIRLDIYRYVCDYKKREFAKWQKKYSKYDLQNIHDGEFWKMILDKEAVGEKKFFDGRNVESKDSTLACNYLKESFEIYDEIKDLISANRSFILKAKFKYQRVTVWSHVMGFLLGVGASVLASWVWTCVLKM